MSQLARIVSSGMKYPRRLAHGLDSGLCSYSRYRFAYSSLSLQTEFNFGWNNCKYSTHSASYQRWMSTMEKSTTMQLTTFLPGKHATLAGNTHQSRQYIWLPKRHFGGTSVMAWPNEELKVLDDKSKVEKFIDFQRKKKENELKLQNVISKQALKDAFIYMPDKKVSEEEVVKKSIWERVKHEAMHYYGGFRLLYLEVKISARLLWQVLNGKTLSRRERRQFLRTAGDLFRLVPFSIFLIVPFMEFLLPVAVKLFPNMLPSTFEDASKKEEAKRKQLKLKLQMAEFLQDTIEEISVATTTTTKSKDKLKEFGNFIEKVRSGWEQPSTSEILKYSKLFEDEVTLDNLPHAQLKAICQLLMIPTYGTSNYLRFTIKIKMKQLQADDQMIRSEGIETLSVQELQSACVARGMRAMGVAKDRLQSQLQQWLELSLDEDIPTALLLLSRAMYIREPLTNEDQLKVTISMLPDRIVDECEIKIAATEGEEVDKQTMIDILNYEEQAIKDEKEADRLKREAKEKEETSKALSEDTSATIASLSDISKEELIELKDKISTERDILDKIKVEREDYKGDVNELLQGSNDGTVSESAASRVLGKRVDRMIKEIDLALDVQQQTSDSRDIDTDKDGIVSTDELFAALVKIDNAPSASKAKQICEILDENKDGIIEVEEMKKILDLISDEDLDMNTEQAAGIVQLIKQQSADIFSIGQILVKGKTNNAVTTVVSSLLKRR